jgi:ribonuclease HII
LNGSDLVGGVDDAGRGCLLGPLIVAGVSVDGRGSRKLRNLGVRDSKLLTSKRRESMFPKIMKIADHVHWAAIPPKEIDEVVLTGRRLRKLNYLEAVYFAKVIDKLHAQKVTVDASDVLPRRFRDDIKGNMATRCEVVAFHKADRDFPVVSAASIIAKVVRDREVALLRQFEGDFGSGYPSDPITRSFFADWMKLGKPFPEYVRQSWKTFERIEQTLLDNF